MSLIFYTITIYTRTINGSGFTNFTKNKKAPDRKSEAFRKFKRKSGLVVMSAWAVCVTVSYFFFGSITNADDFNVEYEVFACEWMVTIEFHVVAFDSDYAEQKHFAVRAGSLELIVFLKLIRVWKFRAWHFNDQLIVVSSICVCSSNFDLAFVTHAQKSHGFFETWDDLTNTFHVGKWITGVTGSIDNFAGFVSQGVME